jgi:hypothetical protein
MAAVRKASKPKRPKRTRNSIPEDEAIDLATQGNFEQQKP